MNFARTLALSLISALALANAPEPLDISIVYRNTSPAAAKLNENLQYISEGRIVSAESSPENVVVEFEVRDPGRTGFLGIGKRAASTVTKRVTFTGEQAAVLYSSLVQRDSGVLATRSGGGKSIGLATGLSFDVSDNSFSIPQANPSGAKLQVTVFSPAIVEGVTPVSGGRDLPLASLSSADLIRTVDTLGQPPQNFGVRMPDNRVARFIVLTLSASGQMSGYFPKDREALEPGDKLKIYRFPLEALQIPTSPEDFKKWEAGEKITFLDHELRKRKKVETAFADQGRRLLAEMHQRTWETTLQTAFTGQRLAPSYQILKEGTHDQLVAAMPMSLVFDGTMPVTSALRRCEQSFRAVEGE